MGKKMVIKVSQTVCSKVKINKNDPASIIIDITSKRKKLFLIFFFVYSRLSCNCQFTNPNK